MFSLDLLVHFIDRLNAVQFVFLGCLAFGLGLPATVIFLHDVVRPLVKRFCPPDRRESPASAVTAPVGVTGRRGTRQPSKNRLEWLHISLFLEDLPTRSGVSHG